jgi:hypothetical protein
VRKIESHIKETNTRTGEGKKEGEERRDKKNETKKGKCEVSVHAVAGD